MRPGLVMYTNGSTYEATVPMGASSVVGYGVTPTGAMVAAVLRAMLRVPRIRGAQ